MTGVGSGGPDEDLLAPDQLGARDDPDRRTDGAAVVEELEALRKEREELSRQLAEAHEEIELLSARIAVTVARDEHAIEALTQAAVKSGELQKEIDALRRSMSWRVTSVLRWVSRKARGLGRRVVRKALGR